METGEFKVNLLDTPGMFDYEGEAVEGIAASGCGLITVSGKSGVRVGTHKAYDLAKKMGKPTMFVVTKLDDDNANFNNVLTQLKAEFGPTVCPVVVPVIADRKIVSYVNLIDISMKTARQLKLICLQLRYQRKWAIVSTDLLKPCPKPLQKLTRRFLKSSSQAKHSHRKSLPTEYIAA